MPKLHAILPPSLLGLTVLAACVGPTGHGSGTEPAVPPQGIADRGAARSSAGAPDGELGPLPPGVIAQAQGHQGVIRVEERDGLRMLTIDGVVHAAQPLSGATGADPVTGLVKALRADAKTALVIGLGSGKTASDLARAGLTVAVVELEPAVIEFARRHFGYRGHAVTGEGFAHLRAHPQRYDVVLMDAFSRTQPPAQLKTPGALGLLSARTRDGGLTLLRLFGEPRRELVEQLRSQLEPPGRRHPLVDLWLFGSGVGREPQNLVVAASTAGLSLHEAKDLRLWPITLPRSEPAGHELIDPFAGRPATTRRVKLEGYLIRLKGGELALDLPHWEMGAQRYLLKGTEAAKLGKLLAANTSFPTSGDIHSDGDTSATLREALGGGGYKRSDVRFSPVAVSLEGDARLVTRVHPDRALRVPRSIRGDVQSDPRLPYGGALYELTVTGVSWTVDRARWIALTTRLRPHITKAVTQIRAGQLGNAQIAIDQYLVAFRQQLAGASFVFLGNLEAWSTALAAGASELGQGPSNYGQARQCDRALGTELQNLWSAPQDIQRLRAALFACATTRYRATADQGSPELRKWAAARLMEILAFHDPAGLTDSAASDRAQRQADALQARFPDVAPLSEVPPLKPIGDPPRR